MYSKHISKLLYAADYPIYGVATDGGGRIYILGGGGHGNYGVPNMIEILRHTDEKSNVLCATTATQGAFNNIGLATDNRHFVVGLEGDSVLYRLDLNDDKAAAKLRSIATCKPKDDEQEPFQTAVTNICSWRVACGSANKYIALRRILPNGKGLETMLTIPTPRQPDSITLSHDGCTLAAACRTDQLLVWTLNAGNSPKATAQPGLTWQSSRGGNVPYLARSCCFGQPVLPGGDAAPKENSQPLYVGFVPPNQHAGKLPSCVVKYTGDRARPAAHRYLSNRGLSVVKASACGGYIGVGDMEGGLVVLDHKLNIITSSQAHGLFVTDVAFLPHPSDPEQAPALLSVSADRNCAITPCKAGYTNVRIAYVIAVVLLALLVYVLATAEGAQDL
eukprot:TRINITY_DN9845_c0_g1_i7.p1 TRINITY_DN9845_c0_g1~~TRINITY_DN9845_c0_g1_i7.p1  ORF type:complete len:437 (+),score=67.04 TRINITY_DN9845_c0_g1_i7:143-1312(+)